MTGVLLPAALARLIVLLVRGRCRRALRGLRTPRGILSLAAALAIFTLYLGPTLAIGLTTQRTDPDVVRAFLAPGLFAFCLMTVAAMGPDSGVVFQPAEVDLLFPGPFTRRQLLLYRLCGTALGSALLALFFSVMILQHVSYWIAGFTGAFLALSFVTLVQMSAAIVVATIAEHAYTRLRRAFLAAAGLAVAVGVWQSLRSTQAAGFSGLLTAFRDTIVGSVLLAPFDVFSRTITAESIFPGLAVWGGLALAIDALIVTVVLGLDANYLENSVKASQRLYEKIQRARRGAALLNLSKPSSARWRLPCFPWWRGAGPIAWRQTITALRSSRGLFYLLSILAVSAALPSLAGGREGAAWGGVMILSMLSLFFLPQVLQFDFRGDVERLDVIKSLPVGAVAVAVGELAAPVSMASAVELLTIGGITLLMPQARSVLAGAAIAVVPANLVVFGVENLVFLLFPFRTTSAAAGDIQAFGRQMLVMFVKMFCVTAAAGVAAGAGALAWWLTSESLAAGIITASAVLALGGVALVLLVALAFGRYDPSRDVPA